jgi:hypothetical protein
MWDWINCHLLGRHEQSIACDQGSIHLRCLRCGHRSSGWQVDEQQVTLQPAKARPHRALMQLVVRRQA